MSWVQGLPAKVRPAALAERFPRIVNRLARYWDSPRMITEIFDDLLVGKRLRRKGFPADSLAELRLLHDYHESLHPEATCEVWNFLSDVERRQGRGNHRGFNSHLQSDRSIAKVRLWTSG